MHIGQTEIPSGMVIGQFLVGQSELMLDRGLDVVDMDGVFGRVESKVVRLSHGETRLMLPPAIHIVYA